MRLLLFVWLVLALLQGLASEETSDVDPSMGHSHHPYHSHHAMPTVFSPAVMAKVRLIKCQRPSPCNASAAQSLQAHPAMLNKLFNQLPAGNEAIIDTKHRVLMDWTAKADCSSAVNMFFAHLGFSYGRNFTELPHAYRPAYYRHCGFPGLCQYLDPSWVKFKMVRNPYDRAVSSFVHIMRHPSIVKLNESVARHWTFRTYLTTLDRLPMKKRYYYGLYHAGYQHRAFELFFWQHFNRSVFHEVVHIEDPEPGIQRVNQLYLKHQNITSATKKRVIPESELFALTRLSHHFVKRSANQSLGFLGDTPWTQIGADNIPKDYGLFYNTELQQLAEKLFHWDLVLYNYSFPFAEHAWFHPLSK